MTICGTDSSDCLTPGDMLYQKTASIGEIRRFFGLFQWNEYKLLASSSKYAVEACSYKGKYYKIGESFYDDCNNCFCGDSDMVQCTFMFCSKRDLGKKEGCSYKGKEYKVGASFYDDCNTCRCSGNDVVACTKMLCPVDYKGTEEVCVYKEQVYKVGASFKDRCNTCFCDTKNRVSCTKVLCPTTNEDIAKLRLHLTNEKIVTLSAPKKD
ncbi:kielin chordin [Octopus vulgaris]|uniref:Kielin chordin n=1 Tax=Octopus vulgaris TaxID=6645 RepID=A0AA36BXP6_OCTVU|nr:kielin chordin [Octopus vulgaris]